VLRAAIAAGAALTKRTERTGVVAGAEAVVNTAHAKAVESFLADNRLEARNVAVVGFHGETVLHRPERHLAVQIGDGCALAGRLGIAVIYDFRSADVAAGGQGAPLAPLFHRALVRLSGARGAGRRAQYRVRMLAGRLAPARVETADQAGWSTDAIKAQAFAYLAVRSLRGLPISLPSTTGVPHPLTGGVLACA
jgi:1,6-anhydro-N-acetylmuramate kinase